MPETGEKERNYLFKSYTDLEYWKLNVSNKILKSSRIATDAQSFPLPVPSPGYRVSGKEVEVRDSGSRHHQLCGCRNLQLIQSHEAPSQAHQEESFLPFSSWQSLSCCLSRMAKRSTPKPRGPLYSPSEPCGPFPHFRTAWSSLYFGAMWSTPSLRATWSPPTVSYTCQHPRILPALLGCHSKSGQVWLHGMEPIISKLSHRPCN